MLEYVVVFVCVRQSIDRSINQWIGGLEDWRTVQLGREYVSSVTRSSSDK